jgi:hypothetical protein
MSAPVTFTTCEKSDYNGGTSTEPRADCRNNPGYDGHLFSGCVVASNAASMCPAPWRLPSHADMCAFLGTEACVKSEWYQTSVDPAVSWPLTGAVTRDGALYDQGENHQVWCAPAPELAYDPSVLIVVDDVQVTSVRTGYGVVARCVR